MPAELQHPVLKRRKIAHTYFVGRREFEIAELYAVSASDVERLGTDRVHGEPGLDWWGGDTAVLELGRLLLERVVEPPPSSELTTDFALSVLGVLPKHGFVLDADAVWRWALLASRSEERTSRESRTNRSWFARLVGVWSSGAR
jgi:hypothetical protein